MAIPLERIMTCSPRDFFGPLHDYTADYTIEGWHNDLDVNSEYHAEQAKELIAKKIPSTVEYLFDYRDCYLSKHNKYIVTATAFRKKK